MSLLRRRRTIDAFVQPIRRLYHSLRDRAILRKSLQRKYGFSWPKRLLRPFLGKVGGQAVYQALYRLALAGMNICGDAGVVFYSGEQEAFKYAIKTVAERYPPNEAIIVFDVGANVGTYALMAAPLLLDRFRAGQIHAFEPSSSTFSQLTANVSGLGTVTVHRSALGDYSGSTILYQINEGSGLASLYDRQKGSLEEYGLKSTIMEEVELETIDGFCLNNSISRIHFLKLDTEGYEFKILQGAKSMLEKDAIDFIQFEFAAGCIDSRVFVKDFVDLLGPQYRLSRILRNGLLPLPKYSAKLEIFSCANYLAERSHE